MNWVIKSGTYQIWKEFSLNLPLDLTFSVGLSYLLQGNNGSGKSSFIRKLLIPYLQNCADKQYVIYIEQQIQSQFIAVKANALLRKTGIEINSPEAMITYLFRSLSCKQLHQPRPLIIILDEVPYLTLLEEQLSTLKTFQPCIIASTHLETQRFLPDDARSILFREIDNAKSEVRQQ